MPESYRFTYIGGTGEITEKKSRFIAAVEPVKSEEEAMAFIERIRRQHWDASHNCTAFTISSPGAATTGSLPEQPDALCWMSS